MNLKYPINGRYTTLGDLIHEYGKYSVLITTTMDAAESKTTFSDPETGIWETDVNTGDLRAVKPYEIVSFENVYSDTEKDGTKMKLVQVNSSDYSFDRPILASEINTKGTDASFPFRFVIGEEDNGGYYFNYKMQSGEAVVMYALRNILRLNGNNITDLIKWFNLSEAPKNTSIFDNNELRPDAYIYIGSKEYDSSIFDNVSNEELKYYITLYNNALRFYSSWVDGFEFNNELSKKTYKQNEPVLRCDLNIVKYILGIEITSAVHNWKTALPLGPITANTFITIDLEYKITYKNIPSTDTPHKMSFDLSWQDIIDAYESDTNSYKSKYHWYMLLAYPGETNISERLSTDNKANPLIYNYSDISFPCIIDGIPKSAPENASVSDCSLGTLKWPLSVAANGGLKVSNKEELARTVANPEAGYGDTYDINLFSSPNISEPGVFVMDFLVNHNAKYELYWNVAPFGMLRIHNVYEETTRNQLNSSYYVDVSILRCYNYYYESDLESLSEPTVTLYYEPVYDIEKPNTELISINKDITTVGEVGEITDVTEENKDTSTNLDNWFIDKIDRASSKYENEFCAYSTPAIYNKENIYVTRSLYKGQYYIYASGAKEEKKDSVEETTYNIDKNIILYYLNIDTDEWVKDTLSTITLNVTKTVGDRHLVNQYLINLDSTGSSSSRTAKYWKFKFADETKYYYFRLMSYDANKDKTVSIQPLYISDYEHSGASSIEYILTHSTSKTALKLNGVLYDKEEANESPYNNINTENYLSIPFGATTPILSLLNKISDLSAETCNSWFKPTSVNVNETYNVYVFNTEDCMHAVCLSNDDITDIAKNQTTALANIKKAFIKTILKEDLYKSLQVKATSNPLLYLGFAPIYGISPSISWDVSVYKTITGLSKPELIKVGSSEITDWHTYYTTTMDSAYKDYISESDGILLNPVLTNVAYTGTSGESGSIKNSGGLFIKTIFTPLTYLTTDSITFNSLSLVNFLEDIAEKYTFECVITNTGETIINSDNNDYLMSSKALDENDEDIVKYIYKSTITDITLSVLSLLSNFRTYLFGDAYNTLYIGLTLTEISDKFIVRWYDVNQQYVLIKSVSIYIKNSDGTETTTEIDDHGTVPKGTILKIEYEIKVESSFNGIRYIETNNSDESGINTVYPKVESFPTEAGTYTIIVDDNPVNGNIQLISLITDTAGKSSGGDEEKVTIITIADPTDGGTITGGGSYTKGSTITLVATPNKGYYFSKWNDGIETASREIGVTADTTYTASFLQGWVLTVSVYKNNITANAGKIQIESNSEGDTDTYNYKNGVTANIKAIVKDTTNYYFNCWIRSDKKDRTGNAVGEGTSGSTGSTISSNFNKSATIGMYTDVDVIAVFSNFNTSESETTDYADPLDIDNKGYEYVDLGLTSGTLWAKTNLGATKDTEAGAYYSWGLGSNSTSKTNFTEDTYAAETFEYNSITYPLPICISRNSILLQTCDDAQKIRGGDWYIPTSAEFTELIQNCNVAVENNGCKFTSKLNGNSISLPLTGYKSSATVTGENTTAYYWTANSVDTGISSAYICLLSSTNTDDNKPSLSNILRHIGCTIRPVIRRDVTHEYLLTLTKNGNTNIGTACNIELYNNENTLICTTDKSVPINYEVKPLTKLTLKFVGTDYTFNNWEISWTDKSGAKKTDSSITSNPYTFNMYFWNVEITANCTYKTTS